MSGGDRVVVAGDLVAVSGDPGPSRVGELHPSGGYSSRPPGEVASRPTSVADTIDPSNVGASPGVPGSTDEGCEALAKDINTLTAAGYAEALSGDAALGEAEANLAAEETQQLDNSCIVMD